MRWDIIDRFSKKKTQRILDLCCKSILSFNSWYRSISIFLSHLFNCFTILFCSSLTRIRSYLYIRPWTPLPINDFWIHTCVLYSHKHYISAFYTYLYNIACTRAYVPDGVILHDAGLQELEREAVYILRSHVFRCDGGLRKRVGGCRMGRYCTNRYTNNSTITIRSRATPTSRRTKIQNNKYIVSTTRARSVGTLHVGLDLW